MNNSLTTRGISPNEADAIIAAHEAEAAAKKKAADEAWRTRTINAIDKLKKIRQDIVDGKTDVKAGSLIFIDGLVFTV